MAAPIALVTGATRGIGRACAAALAAAGYDVAGAARGDPSGMVADVESCGRRALPLVMDLTDPASVAAAADAALDALGRIDLLLHNAIWLHPGSNAPFADADLDALGSAVQANVLGPLALTQRLLPGMRERGSGIVMHVTSVAAVSDPRQAGGWSYAYGMQKAALHRLIGVLHAEHSAEGIRAYNVQPGVVLTDATLAAFGDDPEVHRRYGVVPPELPASVVAWLATSPDAVELSGKMVVARDVARERGLFTLPEES